MNPIQMVDLKSQYIKIKDEIDQAIYKVIDETNFINGPEVKHFSEQLSEYLGVKHVIPCANGTDALQLALMALGCRPGDEIIVPTFTYVATVEVISLLGLTPVFVDSDPNYFNMDVNQIRSKISERTKAIMPVHLYGQCADMETILSICKEKKLHIIEDTAQAIGADYYFKDGTSKKAGTIGTIGATSFFPSKNLGCFGDGGALFTDDDDLAEKMRIIANHGQKVKYYHNLIGVNSRLDTLQAAVLQVKLKYLDQYIESRRRLAELYDQAIGQNPNLIIPRRSGYSSHVFHQYTLQLVDTDREDLKSFLQNKGIPTMIYYPVPLHLQEAYIGYGYKDGDFPIAEKMCKSVMSLPMHTEMEKGQADYIVENFNNYFK